MRIRQLSLLTLAIGAVGVATVMSSIPAGADAALPPSFESSATADGVRVTTTVPGAPLSDGLVDVSTGSAQAVVDAVGVNRAFAAVPYPGATLTNLLDVLRGATGAPIPSYPLIAASDYPTVPDAAVTQPGMGLEAHSQSGSAEARLVTGGGDDTTALLRTIGRAHAGAAADGTILAEATSVTTGLHVGPLQIGRITSSARVVRVGTADPQREQSLDVTGLSVSGQSLSLGPGGLASGSTTVPLPDSHPARVALAQAGIDIRYLEPTDTPDGVLSAGLVISQVVPASPTGQSSRITYTVGRARVAVVVGTAGPTADASSPTLPSGTGSSEPSAPTPGAPSPGTAAAPSPGGGLPLPVTDRDVSLASAAGVPISWPASGLGVNGSPAPTGTGTPIGERRPATATARSSSPSATAVALATATRSPERWSGRFYSSLVAAGALVLLAFAAARSLGVKTVWNS